MRELQFRYTKEVDKFFKIHGDIEIKFEADIVKFCQGEKVDIKQMRGYKDLLRMRIGSYRVIYRVDNGNIIIINVLKAGSRGDVYK